MSKEVQVANLAIISGPDVLLLERSGRLDNPGRLGFSGGIIEPTDEIERDAAFRETLEETGIPTDALAVFNQAEYVIDGHKSIKDAPAIKSIHLHLFIANLVAPRPVIQLSPSEHVSSAWINIESIIDGDLPNEFYDRLLPGVPSMLADLYAHREGYTDPTLKGTRLRKLR